MALSTSAFAQSATTPETVVVTASRYQEEARIQQKDALNIVDVQSAQEIQTFPDFNAAESLSRMPGISLLSDTGEGRFVEIRGLDGNLNGATFGGVVLLNTFPGGTYNGGGGRAVEFDTVPGGIIDGIIVTKTGTPDHDAEGLGGTIELTPRTAANITKPFLEITAGAGYEPIHDHTGPFNAEVTVGGRFGFDDSGLVIEDGRTANHVNPGFVSNPTPFSFVLTGSWREDRRGFDDLEEDYINDPANPATPQSKVYDDLQMRLYNYHRRRFGFGGEFDFKPNDEHRYYVRADVFGYVESVIKNHLIYNALGGDYPSTTTGNSINTQSDITLKGTNEEEWHRNSVFVAGGQDDFHAFQIDYRASYSRATYWQNRNYGSTFTGPTGVFVTYDNTDDPNFPTMKITDGTNVNDPSLFTLSKLSNATERDADSEWSYAGNVAVPVNVFGDSDQVKFGFEVRLRTKDQNQYTQSITGPAGKKISKLNLSLATMNPLAPDTTYYDDHYTNGPGINQNSLLGLIQNGTLVAGPMTFDPTGYFNASENIYAGYAMYTGQYGPWGVLAGVRVEDTVAKYGFYNFDADGNPLPPPNNFVRVPKDYINFFPTVQVRYNFSDEFLARVTYSTGVGRPGFNQVAFATTVDDTTGHISTGNPDLKPTTGDNFDLTLEYYLNDGGIAQFGAFDKEFTNYIFSREIKVASDSRLPDWKPVFLDSYGNIDSAYARGIEASYQQKFSFLPRPFDGVGLEGNVTFVTSSGAARPGEEHALPGTSPTTFNASLFYDAYGVQLRLASEYVGHSLYQVGGDRAQDQFEDSRFTLDWTSSYDVFENASVYFNVKNITNAPLRIYTGAPNWVIQREFYDETFEGGVRIKLGE